MQVSIKNQQNYLCECAGGVSKLPKLVDCLREEPPKRF
jgi:hypothetical protein